MPQTNDLSIRFLDVGAIVRRGGWLLGACVMLCGCEVTQLPADPETFVEVEFTTFRANEPDSVSWTIGKQKGWATQAKVSRDTARKTSTFWYRTPAPNPPDTVRFGLRQLGMQFATIDMAPQGDGTYLRQSPVSHLVAGKLLFRLDSLARVPGSGLTRSRSGLEILAARLLLDSDSLLKDKKQLPADLDKKVLDSLALREAVKGATPLEILSRSWLLDLTFEQARAKLESWVAQKLPGIDSAAYRRMVPLDNFPPEIVRLTADTLTVVKGGGKRSFVVEFQDDSGMVSAKHSVWQNNLDVSSLFSLEAPAFPSHRPVSWVCTLKVATGTAAVGAYTLKTDVTDNKNQKSSKEVTFQVADDGRVVEPPPVNHAPGVTRQDPLEALVVVSDLTTSLSFQWTVMDVDNNLGKVLLQDKDITLQNNIAKASVDLKLGDTTRVVLKAADQGGLETSDTVRVFRRQAVKAEIRYLTGASKDTILPDTQSTFKVRWSVTDSDLDSVRVQSVVRKAAEGPEFEHLLRLSPGASEIVHLVAYSRFGEPARDSVKVTRPDPRDRWKEVISAVQSGKDTVPLLDLRPGVRMGQFEVTRALWARHTGGTIANDSAGFPATGMTFYEAVRFCNALSKSKGLDTLYTWAASSSTASFLDSVRIRSESSLKGFRMPTPGEMDTAFAAWGGPYPWGASVESGLASQFAAIGGEKMGQVGSKLPTGPGFFDLAGNAAEWLTKSGGFIGSGTRWFVGGGDASTTPVSSVTTTRKEAGTNRSDLTGMRLVRVGQD